MVGYPRRVLSSSSNRDSLLYCNKMFSCKKKIIYKYIHIITSRLLESNHVNIRELAINNGYQKIDGSQLLRLTKEFDNSSHREKLNYVLIEPLPQSPAVDAYERV